MRRIATYGEIESTLPKTCLGCGKPNSGVTWYTGCTFVPYVEEWIVFGETKGADEHLAWTCRTCEFVFRTPSARQFHQEEKTE